MVVARLALSAVTEAVVDVECLLVYYVQDNTNNVGK
jgi:hypothetical protein